MSCKSLFAVLKVTPHQIAIVPYDVADDGSATLPKGLDERWELVDLESVPEQVDGASMEFVTLDEAVSYQSYWQEHQTVARPTFH